MNLPQAYKPTGKHDPLAEEAAQVTQRATWRHGVEIAAALSVLRGRSISARQVRYFGEAHEEKSKSGPWAEAARLLLAQLAAQPDRERALAPLRWLEQLAGLAPGVPLDDDGPSTLPLDAAAALGAFGRLLDTLERSLADRHKSPDELLDARQLLAELVARASTLFEHLERLPEVGR